jgi:ferredoxin, 2Fe-2S
LRIFATDYDGTQRTLEGHQGSSVMEVLRQNGFAIAAECGGACACATCHVYVSDKWFARLPPPMSNELDMLEMAPGVAPTSRLSCQIACAESLDGLIVTVAPI